MLKLQEKAFKIYLGIKY